MPEPGLEWSSPVGPACLAWLAGPWRRTERSTTDDRRELFRVRHGTDAALTRAPDPYDLLAAASNRLGVALGAPGGPLANIDSLLRILPVGPDPTLTLVDLSRRATAPARVETLLADHPAIITDLDASGPISTRMLIATLPATITLHRNAVVAALHMRVTLVHTARTTLGLAATIVSLGGPGVAALAVPLAWRFLHHLLAEHAASQGQ